MTSDIFRFSARSVVEIHGEGARDFLNRVLTCNIPAPGSEQGRYGALLTPQGKIISDLFVYTGPNGLFMDLPNSMADSVVKRLTLLKLRADASFELRADLSAFVCFTPAPANALASFKDDRFLEPAYRFIATPNTFGDDTPEAETSDRYQASRIAGVLSEFEADYGTTDAFPADINMDLLNGVDYKKGCFIGQEVASRMKRKTEVRKRTLRVSQLPETAATGDAIIAGESTLGTLTSVWQGEGLAQIRLDRWKKAADENLSPEVNTVPVQIHDLREPIS